ncbi:single-stranded DNA-binding protein [Laspinema olomoucense]|uniref:single-stranded DNA-binding protein n=1 Tax=Laspinema olomoucense TaxID=3231600 RepID=UPI0021BB7719|nr:single-stranded DNA-binding protein [Laspinema sp. D3d]MCT7973398.1 single-stranded DNA-binding protein [Laspinema sp. D3d]
MNSANIVGRVGQNPELRYFESGRVLAKFSIAVNRSNRSDQPNWFSVELWGKTAEVAANYLRKGSTVGISGSLKLDEWTDPNTGEVRSRPVIKGRRLELLGSKSADSNYPNSSTPNDF